MPGFGFASIDDPLHYKVLKSCKFKMHKWIFHSSEDQCSPVMITLLNSLNHNYYN